jgi:hypothetical protein
VRESNDDVNRDSEPEVQDRAKIPCATERTETLNQRRQSGTSELGSESAGAFPRNYREKGKREKEESGGERKKE